MKPKGISFTPENLAQVRAGLKTQTRREITPQPDDRINYRYDGPDEDDIHWLERTDNQGNGFEWYDKLGKSPYGTTGQIFYARQKHRILGGGHTSLPESPQTVVSPWVLVEFEDSDKPVKIPVSEKTYLKIKASKSIGRWRSSRFMFQEFARTWLRVTEPVGVERLSEISKEDAIAEGCIMGQDGFPEPVSDPDGADMFSFDDPREWYVWVWESIHGPDTFDSRFVWVVKFELIEKPENLK